MNSIEKAMMRKGKIPSEKARQQANPMDNHNDNTYTHNDSSSGNKCQLDYQQLKKDGFLVSTEAVSNKAEEFKRIKRPLLRNALGKGVTTVENGNLILVTSALPKEGKSYISFNLAMSMATEMDITVLLIDADVYKTSLTNMLGLKGRLGLTDLLVDPKLDLADVINDTDMPRLKILPAGSHTTHVTELLASSQMSQLTQKFSDSDKNCMVIFDTPPLLASSDANVLSHYAGQLVMVVEAANTSQTMIKDAVSMLDSKKAIGMILNKSRTAHNHEYYGGYFEGVGT